ncbi:hypothetical protein EVAR_79429_1 [Eumeta japonica]|uniref:Uncharacterized protein n=1 Tax=Eumeta variegata TaxID=151549 RepID=A0A4C1VIE7_EUMVA|nr:hypothetical protein EVAR_79429_1 [Eumeta japonica]
MNECITHIISTDYRNSSRRVFTVGNSIGTRLERRCLLRGRASWAGGGRVARVRGAGRGHPKPSYLTALAKLDSASRP